jgi:hypothetical protein
LVVFSTCSNTSHRVAYGIFFWGDAVFDMAAGDGFRMDSFRSFFVLVEYSWHNLSFPASFFMGEVGAIGEPKKFLVKLYHK